MRGQRFAVPAAKERGASFTLYGAIGTCLQENNSYFEIHDSTNAIDVASFMENLKDQIKPELIGSKIILVADNHNANKGDRIDVMKEFCTPEFIPPYSCCLNEPIEATWAVLKQRILPVFTKLSIRKTSSR